MCDANDSFLLHSQTLQQYLEILMSMVGDMIGKHNSTLTGFGYSIELFPGCGTLNEIINPVTGGKLRVTKWACKNSLGKDYAAKIANDIIDLFVGRFISSQSLQCLTLLPKRTNGAFEDVCSIKYDSEGHIISVPDPKGYLTFFMRTEVRDEEQEAVARGI